MLQGAPPRLLVMQAADQSQGLYCPSCRAIYQGALSRCPNDGAELALFDQDPMVGLQIADYIIEDFLGEGATGRVYRARHARLERRKYAIKILLGDLAMDATMRTRFEHEAQAASRIDHPNLVGVHDFGQSDTGLFYIVMEFVRGETLADRIHRFGRLSAQETVYLCRALCNGLAHAHEQGLVHRDFKPENVVVLEQDGMLKPRILDFGLAIVQAPGESSARLTATGGIVGTPAYASPEQICAGDVDQRTDLFALGVTMYEMLSGRLPFDGNIMEILVANANKKHPSIDERSGVKVHPELEAIVDRLMAKTASDRFATARELLAALDQVAGTLGVAIPSTSAMAVQ
ncbi:MAG: serine/threonine protein kinase, partial [Deltaproteobacteria bacterium]|nr:serine/threonine protein kinase [Deltaproteobacteria bacterium]